MPRSPHAPRRRRCLTRRAALALPLAFALPGRARADLPPIIDALGRSIALPGPASRIAIAFNFEEFTAIGGLDGWRRVVGFNRRQWAVNRQALWNRYRTVIPGLTDIPDIGAADDGSFSAELTLAQRPDLLIIHEFGFTSLRAQMERIAAAGVPILVIDYNTQSLERHVASTLAIGAAIGAGERAQALAALYADRLAEIRRRAAAAGTAPKVYVELGMGGAGTVGNSYNTAMWGRMLETVGAANIARGRITGGWGPLAPEYVLAAAPDFIFIIGSSWTGQPNAVQAGYDADIEATRRSLAPYAARPGWRDLPAIRRGELHAIEAGLARSLIDWVAMQYIAKRLWPSQFAEIDPVDSLRLYHDRFLPIRFEGTWMARLDRT